MIQPTMPGGDDLQFDSIAPRQTGPAVTCVVCQRQVLDEYYEINGRTTCASCRAALAAHDTTAIGAGPTALALLFGAGAAIAGAAIYYAVIAIANLEIGIVAILIGYMVGWAIRKATHGRGGRAFQVIAVILTYWAVGLAYTPLALPGFPVPIVVVYAFALPVLIVIQGFPSGLISGIIIAIGMRQAWRMTGAHRFVVNGPYRIGSSTTPVAGQQ